MKISPELNGLINGLRARWLLQEQSKNVSFNETLNLVGLLGINLVSFPNRIERLDKNQIERLKDYITYKDNDIRTNKGWLEHFIKDELRKNIERMKRIY